MDDGFGVALYQISLVKKIEEEQNVSALQKNLLNIQYVAINGKSNNGIQC